MGKLGSLILVRGVPGSGKSTFAKCYPDHNHLETDMFFMVDGEYKFDHTKLGEYHDKCQQQTQELLDRGDDVIVTNTFVRLWELEKYLNMNYSDVDVFRMISDFVNIHKVPTEIIDRMKKNFDDYVGETLVVD